MKVSMIAAFDENRLIGAVGSGIPWDLPRDRRRFREYTEGKVMLLGRRTFEEMAGWFVSQRPIVMTRNRDDALSDSPEGIRVVASVGAAIELAQAAGEVELVVSGGAQIYQQALPFADELVLTEIHAVCDGIAYFPDFVGSDWDEVQRERFEADADNRYAMSFVTLRRRPMRGVIEGGAQRVLI